MHVWGGNSPPSNSLSLFAGQTWDFLSAACGQLSQAVFLQLNALTPGNFYHLLITLKAKPCFL